MFVDTRVANAFFPFGCGATFLFCCIGCYWRKRFVCCMLEKKFGQFRSVYGWMSCRRFRNPVEVQQKLSNDRHIISCAQ